ncbi:MAG: DUF5665 domain-containing protein [Firmicutes bacterium]|nr:DUF5665 domain-containing protein [Bacillota bacterium]
MANLYRDTLRTKKIKNTRLRKVGGGLAANLAFGLVRGIGMAAGFSGIAVILLFLMRFLPLDKIPLVGDIVRKIVGK